MSARTVSTRAKKGGERKRESSSHPPDRWIVLSAQLGMIYDSMHDPNITIFV